MTALTRKIVSTVLAFLVVLGLAGPAIAGPKVGLGNSTVFSVGGRPSKGALTCSTVLNIPGLRVVELWIDIDAPEKGDFAHYVDFDARIQGSGSAQTVDLGAVVPSKSIRDYYRFAFFTVPPNSRSSVNSSGGGIMTISKSRVPFVPNNIYVDCPVTTDGNFDPFYVAVNEFGDSKTPNAFQRVSAGSTPSRGWSFSLPEIYFPPLPEWIGNAMRSFAQDR